MPYGLFDYGGTIQTMGATKQITTRAVGEESPAPCPMPKVPNCKANEESYIQSYRDIPNCGRLPMYACRPRKPKCPTTLTQGGCNYRLV
jgi:hypothetical protein